MNTGLESLLMVARYHHIQPSKEALNDTWQNSSTDCADPIQHLQNIARSIGLNSGLIDVTWEKLLKLGGAFPVMVVLNNSKFVVACGVKLNEQGQALLLVQDPLSNKENELLQLPQTTFCKEWGGKVILLKPINQELEVKKPFGFSWLIEQACGQKKLIAQVFLISFVMHLLAFVVPIFTMTVFDKVIRFSGYSTLHVLFVGALMILVFNALFGYMRSLLILHMAGRLEIIMTDRITKNILGLPLSFFQKIPAGKLLKNIQDANQVREFIQGNLLYTLIEATSFIIVLPVLFLFSTELTFVVIALASLIALSILLSMNTHKKRMTKLYEVEAQRQSMIAESIMGVETLKSLAIEDEYYKKLLSTSAKASYLQKSVGRLSAVLSEFSGFIQKLMSLVIIWLGAQMVLQGQLTIGALIAFNIMAGRIAGPLVQMVGLIKKYEEVAISIKMLSKVLNQPPERLREGGITPPLKGAVEFRSVDFYYDKTQPKTLDQINFLIKPGMKVGIVGPSGSGKSTVAKLLQGLFKPDGGYVRFDGMSISEFDLNYLRSSLGVVSQDSYLFKGSVHQNIAKASPVSSREKVIDVAKLVGAHEFIESLPQGYDTELEEQAANLSGGQRQRLCFARALLQKPKVLILDEATSGLDAQSEHLIYENLNRICAGATLINISHRLASMPEMDLILVLESGSLVASGKHQQLLQQPGTYQDLWQQQFSSALEVA